jgi:hypothetical protein
MSDRRKKKKPLTNICHCAHAWDEHHNSGIKAGWAEECVTLAVAGGARTIFGETF